MKSYLAKARHHFFLTKEEKKSLSKLEQGSLLTISELNNGTLGRALVSCSIPEGRVMKWQKISTFYFTAHRQQLNYDESKVLILLSYAIFFHTQVFCIYIEAYLNSTLLLQTFGNSYTCFSKILPYAMNLWFSAFLGLWRHHQSEKQCKSEMEQTLLKTKLKTSEKLQASYLFYISVTSTA